MESFWIGVVIGLIAGLVLASILDKPEVVNNNDIDIKNKKSNGVDITATASSDTPTKKRKKFLGIFPRKNKKR